MTIRKQLFIHATGLAIAGMGQYYTNQLKYNMYTTYHPQPQVRVSGIDIHVKEIILVIMALFLLIFSWCRFYEQWRNKYKYPLHTRSAANLGSDIWV